jgi:hypothetical protein
LVSVSPHTSIVDLYDENDLFDDFSNGTSPIGTLKANYLTFISTCSFVNNADSGFVTGISRNLAKLDKENDKKNFKQKSDDHRLVLNALTQKAWLPPGKGAFRSLSLSLSPLHHQP